jgi:glycosyltransferase involved in cell wall biosynthesis
MDLLVFSNTASVMFFPSQSLADLFPLKQPKVPLPPAGEFLALPGRPTQSRPTKVLYVGGISERYGLKIMLEALKLANRDGYLGLELVCRPAEFARERAILESYLGLAWLKVHHVAGDALASIYQQCDVGLLPRLRNAYNDMAMPVKLFEYLSYGLPVVATGCTEMADFIIRNRVGLIAEDTPESLAEKILQLVNDPELYRELRRNARRTLENGNLWTDRARLTADCLAVGKKEG